MDNIYRRSCVEVLEILKHVSKDDYHKIPKEELEFYKSNADPEYVYIYDSLNPKTLRKTDAILIYLYKNYIAKEDEKKQIEQALKINKLKNEQEKQKKYSVKNIFKEIEKGDLSTLPTAEIKETIFKKFINKIKKIFHLN